MSPEGQDQRGKKNCWANCHTWCYFWKLSNIIHQPHKKTVNWKENRQTILKQNHWLKISFWALLLVEERSAFLDNERFFREQVPLRALHSPKLAYLKTFCSKCWGMHFATFQEYLHTIILISWLAKFPGSKSEESCINFYSRIAICHHQKAAAAIAMSFKSLSLQWKFRLIVSLLLHIIHHDWGVMCCKVILILIIYLTRGGPYSKVIFPNFKYDAISQTCSELSNFSISESAKFTVAKLWKQKDNKKTKNPTEVQWKHYIKNTITEQICWYLTPNQPRWLC